MPSSRGSSFHINRIPAMIIGRVSLALGAAIVLTGCSVSQSDERAIGSAGLVLLCTLTRVCRSIAGRLAVRVGANALSASYSQHDEAQADSEGVVNTLAAGIDLEGLPSFFEKLFEEQKREPSAVDAFFSTHPSDQSRVAATRKQIVRLRLGAKSALTRDTPDFHAIQARVRVWPAPPKRDSVQADSGR
jgi:predicted Zn-dependent protease